MNIITHIGINYLRVQPVVSQNLHPLLNRNVFYAIHNMRLISISITHANVIAVLHFLLVFAFAF